MSPPGVVPRLDGHNRRVLEHVIAKHHDLRQLAAAPQPWVGLLRRVDLLSLHFMMQRYDLAKWPGRWRPDQVYVFDADNEETVYIGPEVDLIPDLVDELVAEINAADLNSDIIVSAAMAHLNLVMIHPFKDGNGRADLAGKLWLRAEEELARVGLPERCVQPLTYCMSGFYLRNSTYRQLVPDISQNVASRDLNELVKADLLAPEGEKRGRRYVLSAGLRVKALALRDEVNRRLPVTGDPYD